MTEIRTVKAVKDKYEGLLMQIEGVVGVGIGKASRHEMCIRVYLKDKTPELEAAIPKTLEGITVELKEIGEVVAR